MVDLISKVFKRTGNISVTLTGTTLSPIFNIDANDLNMNEDDFLSASTTYVGTFFVETIIIAHGEVATTDAAVVKGFGAFTRYNGGSLTQLTPSNAGDVLNTGTVQTPYMHFYGTASANSFGVNPIELVYSVSSNLININVKNFSTITRNANIKYYITAYGADMIEP